MYKFPLLTGLLLSISGCVSQGDISSPKFGMANPASEYCVKQGGKLEVRNEAQGQVGYCHLPSGQVVEEWDLFRASASTCVASEAAKLVGQKQLSNEDIQKLTHAKLVRQVYPGQAVTMDYRAERVTVTLDKKTKQIINATCG